MTDSLRKAYDTLKAQADKRYEGVLDDVRHNRRSGDRRPEATMIAENLPFATVGSVKLSDLQAVLGALEAVMVSDSDALGARESSQKETPT